MPIEVNELIIRTTVNDSENHKETDAAAKGQITEAEKIQLLNDCVDQVLEILKQRNER